MKPPNLLPAAEQELWEAINWYEEVRPGLGIELLGAVDQALRSISDSPNRYPVWTENPRFRRTVLERFPYLLFYHLAPDGPEIVAVSHARRSPGYCLKRIRS